MTDVNWSSATSESYDLSWETAEDYWAHNPDDPAEHWCHRCVEVDCICV